MAAAERALEDGDARTALALAQQHATDHPEGQLTVERTAIELSARCVLQRAGAQSAAADFLRIHAQAPAAAKVRARCLREKKSPHQ